MDTGSIPSLPPKNYFKNLDKVLINNFIRSKEVRVIDDEGKQLGIMNIFDAIDLAKSKGLDLIQVTEKVEPPICKIADHGKYLYSQQKKEKKMKKPVGGELKETRLSFTISPHDAETKAKQAKKFLEEGNKVKINLVLRGREKAFGHLAAGKVESFLQVLNEIIPIKTERELKREPRGFTTIVSKK